MIIPCLTKARTLFAVGAILFGAQAHATEIAGLPKAEQAAIQRAIQSCGPGRETITSVEYKDGYQKGRITDPAGLFVTLRSTPPAGAMLKGLESSHSKEVNFYRVHGEKDGTPKSFSFDTGEACQYTFAFPITNATLTVLPKPLEREILPDPGSVKYIYVFQQPKGTQFISRTGDVKSTSSEVGFPALIRTNSILQVYEVDFQGNLKLIYESDSRGYLMPTKK